MGKFSHEVAEGNAGLAAPALRSHPDVKAVFAPYDELTKGAVALQLAGQLGSRKVVFRS